MIWIYARSMAMCDYIYRRYEFPGPRRSVKYVSDVIPRAGSRWIQGDTVVIHRTWDDNVANGHLRRMMQLYRHNPTIITIND